MLVFPDTIGLPRNGREHLLTYAATVFNAFGPRNAIFEQANCGKEASFTWVAEACKRHNLADGGWGMAVYEACDRGECLPEEAERLVRSFLTAGVDTTVNGIAHMLLGFGQFPEEYQRMRANPQLAVKAFEESLRWDSSVQTFFRTTTRDVTIENANIPEGSKVLLFLASANRDPRHWENPDIFSLTRNAIGHVGFGFGIHQCLGQMVARLEAEVVARSFIQHIASIRLIAPPKRRLNNTMHALQSLPVEIEIA